MDLISTFPHDVALPVSSTTSLNSKSASYTRLPVVGVDVLSGVLCLDRGRDSTGLISLDCDPGGALHSSHFSSLSSSLSSFPLDPRVACRNQTRAQQQPHIEGNTKPARAPTSYHRSNDVTARNVNAV